MSNLTDEELLEELKRRLKETNDALYGATMANRKLLDINVRMKQSEALKSNFLSNIRNEVNNPLSVIIGFAEQIAAGGLTENVMRSGAASIAAAAQHLNFQMRNIFMAADLEAGENPPVLNRTDVGQLLTDASAEFAHDIVRKQIIVDIGDDDGNELDGLVFDTDADKLRVIVANLIANAIEFSPRGGRVELRAAVERGFLELRVRDRGIGIDEDHHQTIFERFRQLETGPARAHHGHGLGLAVVKALVELLGGTIRVDSAAGKGATFIVRLPPPVGLYAAAGSGFIVEDAQEK